MIYIIAYISIGFLYFCWRYTVAYAEMKKRNAQLILITLHVKADYIFAKALIWPFRIVRYILIKIGDKL